MHRVSKTWCNHLGTLLLMRAYLSIGGLVMARALLSMAVIVIIALLIATTVLRAARSEFDKSLTRGTSSGGNTK
jgi:hypothetical protein